MIGLLLGCFRGGGRGGKPIGRKAREAKIPHMGVVYYGSCAM
jgi:hypothetical protein